MKLEMPPPNPASPNPAETDGRSIFGNDISVAGFHRALVLLSLLALIVRIGFYVEHANTPSFGVPTLDQKCQLDPAAADWPSSALPNHPPTTPLRSVIKWNRRVGLTLFQRGPGASAGGGAASFRLSSSICFCNASGWGDAFLQSSRSWIARAKFPSASSRRARLPAI